jgi:hypothetical protein
MLKSLVRKLAAWVERRELARSVKRKEQQLPPLPKDADPSWERGFKTVFAENIKASQAVAATLFTPGEQRYREERDRRWYAKDEAKRERREAGVTGLFGTLAFVAVVAVAAYYATSIVGVVLAVWLGWGLIKVSNEYWLWRFRVERRLQHAALRGIHKVFIEKMPDDLDQSVSSKIVKQTNRHLVVVLDKAEADAILLAVSDDDRFRNHLITNRYDNFLLVDKAEDTVWSGFASSHLGAESEAEHLVGKLQDAIDESRGE